MSVESTSQNSGQSNLHVALIMDGNGRWAEQKGKPRLFGHRAGARRVREIVQACPDVGVKYVTIYAFSTENWKRSHREVSGLMRLFRGYILREAKSLLAQGVRVRFIGDRSALDAKLVGLMSELESMTANNENVHLTIALNYGGRDELSRAMTRAFSALQSGDLSVDEFSTDDVSQFLDTADLPDPDLVVRTSGETRISNFLLWQSAYAEYEFTPTLWPDYTAQEFQESVVRLSSRERRYGGVKT